MEQIRITDKELQMILDYFKQFQIRLNEMNIDDLILKLKKNELTEKEKQQIIEDFAEIRSTDKRQFVPTEEEINELLGNGKHGGIVRKDTFDDNMDQWPLLHKKTQKFTPEQIEATVMKLKNDDAMFTKEEVNILANALINKMSLSIMHSVRGASEDIWFYYMHGCWPRDPRPNEFLQDHFFDRCYLTPEQIDRVIEVTRDKQWWEMSEREKKDILGNM